MWADGPIQWIMTDEEKRTWQSLTFADERLEFIDRFWEARNPKPGNPDNSYREHVRSPRGFRRRQLRSGAKARAAA